VSGYMVAFNIPRVYRLVFVDKLINARAHVWLVNLVDLRCLLSLTRSVFASLLHKN